jgi:hypothetical protein
VVAKARLLEANAPRRTLSPMDEAQVVRSLADTITSRRRRSSSCSGAAAPGSIDA